MKKLLIILLLLFSIIKVHAYENDYFNIDIPNNYNLTEETTNSYKWIKDNNYIAISLSKSDYNIKEFTKEDINNQKISIEKRINDRLKDFNVKATITSIEKQNIDDLYYLEYDLYLPSKNSIGFDTFQKGRIYTHNGYLITFIFNSDTTINNEEYNTIIKSFIIKDFTIINKYRVYLTLTIIIGAIAGIIGFFVSLKKEKHY